MRQRSSKSKKLSFILPIILLILPLILFCGCNGDEDVVSTDDTTDYIYVPESTTSDGVLTEDQVGSEVCFLNSFAKVGVELKCANYPEGSSYRWKIVSMITGDEKTFENTTGTYTPEKNDLESMITVSVSGSPDISIYCSELPVLYFESDKKYKQINKNEYTEATLSMQGNSSYQNGLYDGLCYIKTRGNSTSNLDKRPFKLRLESKENMLDIGYGKSRHWVLLANAIDHTLLRNKLLYDFSGAIGTEYYMHSENVVLIYNNEYYGVYQLCEQIRIDSTRIDVYDWEDAAEEAAEAVARELRDSGKLPERQYQSKLLELEEFLTTDWSWVDTGKFIYDGEGYSFSKLGITLPARTGGYIIEMDFYSRGSHELATMESAYSQPLYFSGPEPETGDGARSLASTSLYMNAAKYMQSFEYALHSDDFFYKDTDTHYYATGFHSSWGNMDWMPQPADAIDNYGYIYYIYDYTDPDHDGMHYSELFDFDSLINNFIFCEFAMNWDSMKNSFFYYKDVDGLAKIGPQWDFDWAWGNRNMYSINTYYPESWHTTEDAFTVEQYYQKVQWNRMLIRDPYFLVNAYNKYKEIRGTVIEEMLREGGIIETSIDGLRAAAAANDNRWSYSYESYNGEEFIDACESMLEFIETRVAWLDKQFKSLDYFIDSLGYYESSSKIKVNSIETGETETVITASTTNNNAASITFQINGTVMYDIPLQDKTATLTISNSELLQSGVNCVEVKAKNSRGKYLYDEQSSNPGVYNMTISNFDTFTLEK